MSHTAANAFGIMQRIYQKTLAYGFNFFISLIGLPLVIISNIVLWGIVYQYGTISELTLGQMITYQILVYILMSFIYMRKTAGAVNRDIIQGGIVIYQVRPIHYMFYRFFADAVTFLMYGAYSIVLFIIASFFVHFELTSNIMFILLGILSCFLAFCLSFTLSFIIGSVGLWWEKSVGLQNIYSTFATFLAGSWLPLDLFPPLLRAISAWLPFQYIAYVPTKIFIGMFSMEQVFANLGIQIMWTLIFLALALFIWKKGIKQFTGYGA